LGNAQHQERLSAHTDDQRGLGVDLGHHRLRARWWHKALASSQAKACHRLTPSQRARGRSFDLTAPIGPKRHIFGEQVSQLLLGSLNASCSINFTMLGCTENVATARTLREYWSVTSCWSMQSARSALEVNCPRM